MSRWYTPIPERAFIIEVIDADHRVWTAMATERGGILRELERAPVAASITIYEWWLQAPINPPSAAVAMFGKAPAWRLMEQYPWTLETTDD